MAVRLLEKRRAAAAHKGQCRRLRQTPLADVLGGAGEAADARPSSAGASAGTRGAAWRAPVGATRPAVPARPSLSPPAQRPRGSMGAVLSAPGTAGAAIDAQATASDRSTRERRLLLF